jgi:hypothetical protein
MRKVDQINFLFWFVLGAGILWRSAHLGFGSLTQPGPGFLAFGCGVVLVVLAVVVSLSWTNSGMRSKKAMEDQEFLEIMGEIYIPPAYRTPEEYQTLVE